LILSCWQGRIVGEDAITRVVCRLRTLADELAAPELRLQTIKKVGYRITAQSDGDGSTAAAPDETSFIQPGRTAIAVWPFENLSDDQRQQYFADGMVEDITTALSRYASLLVVASGSGKATRSAGLDLQSAASQLGVRYILEGSVRRWADRVRISVKLVDAEVGAHIWADRFEDAIGDLFSLQDRVATAVAGVIEPRLLLAEMRKAASRPTEDMDSYDLYLRAVPLVQSFEVSDLPRALDLLDRAIASDPSFGRALGAAAFVHSQLYQHGAAAEAMSHQEQGFARVRQALRVAGEEPEVVGWIADALTQLGGSLTTAMRLIDRAISLNPGSAYNWFVSGTLRIIAGEPAAGLQLVDYALKLDPMSWIRANMLSWMAMAKLEQRRFSEAIDLLLEARELKASYPTIQPMLAACYAQAGDERAAAIALAQVRFSERRAQAWGEHLFRNAEHRSTFLDGIARARAATLVSETA
jgi:adenylate cyclase